MDSQSTEPVDVEASRRGGRPGVPKLVFGLLCGASALCFAFALLVVAAGTLTTSVDLTGPTLVLAFLLAGVGLVGAIVSGGLAFTFRG